MRIAARHPSRAGSTRRSAFSSPLRALMPTHLLVISGKDSPELKELAKLPSDVNVLAIGRSTSDFAHLTEEAWASVSVLLNCGVGANAGKKADIEVLGKGEGGRCDAWMCTTWS